MINDNTRGEHGGTGSVSVVIPTLNEVAQIGTRLSELRALKVSEILVVDGGSTDGTHEVVSAFDGVRWLTSPAGRARQMNVGARAARGDVLAFVHADVSLPADALTQIRHTLARPGVAAGAFRTWTVIRSPVHSPWWKPILHLADLRSRITRSPYGDQAIFIRRDMFWAVGGFPELAIMEDVAFAPAVRRMGRFYTAPARVTVSGRRFVRHPLYYTLAVNLFPTLFRLGVPPGALARWYGNPRCHR